MGDGQPGHCRLLEDKHCAAGQLVYFENGTLYAGFALPEHTPVFAVSDGRSFEINVTPAGPGNYDPENSYRAVHVSSIDGSQETVVIFQGVDDDPNVHLATVTEGQIIGYISPGTLRPIPGGLQTDAYNLIVEFLGPTLEPDLTTYEEHLGLTP